jgi:hypothetical protein
MSVFGNEILGKKEMCYETECLGFFRGFLVFSCS